MNQLKSKPQQAYELDHNIDRVEEQPSEWIEEWGTADVKLIGELAKNDSFDMIFDKPELIKSIDEIKMEGLLCDFEGIDYLYTEPRLPVMSKRMLYILRAVRDFPHQAIPVVIEDMEMARESLTERSGKINTNYVALQLLEQFNIFDREKSIYEPSFINPNNVGRIEKLVFKVPEKGLPPIFRIIDKPTRLYVSPEAKIALEEAKITGIRFVPIDFD